MIEIGALSDAFLSRMAIHPSARLVSTSEASFEGWFRIELAATVLSLGISESDLRFNFAYPHEVAQGRKADFAVVSGPPIVFELKPFVSGADSNKKSEFPHQTAHLLAAVEAGLFEQGIGFATFLGYTPRRIETLTSSFFPSPWTRLGPVRMRADGDLQYILAEARRIR